MQFEYDPERLIEEVRKRPGVWNYDDVNYRTRETRQKLWREVVHELLQENAQVSKSEMRELELQLQKKWKSIRDCFTKYIQNPNRTKRPYVYNKQLQFLLSKPDAGGDNDGGGGSSESEDGKKVTWSSKKRMKIAKTQETSDDDNDNDNFEEEVIDASSLQEVEINIPNLPKVSKNYKTSNEFAFASVDGEDTDKMFLLSLLPHLKAIPEECRLNVKMELMQVLRQATYGIEHKIY